MSLCFCCIIKNISLLVSTSLSIWQHKPLIIFIHAVLSNFMQKYACKINFALPCKHCLNSGTLFGYAVSNQVIVICRLCCRLQITAKSRKIIYEQLFHLFTPEMKQTMLQLLTIVTTFVYMLYKIFENSSYLGNNDFWILKTSTDQRMRNANVVALNWLN